MGCGTYRHGSAILLELTFARPKRSGVRVRYYLFGIVAKAVAFTIWNLDSSSCGAIRQA